MMVLWPVNRGWRLGQTEQQSSTKEWGAPVHRRMKTAVESMPSSTSHGIQVLKIKLRNAALQLRPQAEDDGTGLDVSGAHHGVQKAPGSLASKEVAESGSSVPQPFGAECRGFLQGSSLHIASRCTASTNFSFAAFARRTCSLARLSWFLAI